MSATAERAAQRRCDTSCPSRGAAMAPQRYDRRPWQRSGELPDSVERVLRSPGKSLPPQARAAMERGFAHDFSAVRVHSDDDAAASARALDTLAYAAGTHIVFGDGHFRPHEPRGMRLLAHELAHTVQQGDGAQPAPLMRRGIVPGPQGDALEREADQLAERVVRGETGVTVRGVASAPHLQREPTPPRVRQSEPQPEETTPPPEPKCGPDATDWFVTQTNLAMRSPAVLGVQSHLATAARFAAMFRLTAGQLGEAGTTVAVLGQERRLGSRAPARTPDARSQIAAGTHSLRAVAAAAPGALGPPTIISPFPSPSSAAALAMTASLGAAALGWRALVNHGAPYDFKAHSMNHPHTAHCPDQACPPGEVGTVTLCHGSAVRNCYESDLPGNLFYALIGRFIGWSELTLQLGSQFAELTDVTPRPARPAVTWDTPEDTAAIALGYRLPLPLTRGALCAALGPARGRMDARHGCGDCPEPTTAPYH